MLHQCGTQQQQQQRAPNSHIDVLNGGNTADHTDCLAAIDTFSCPRRLARCKLLPGSDLRESLSVLSCFALSFLFPLLSLVLRLALRIQVSSCLLSPLVTSWFARLA